MKKKNKISIRNKNTNKNKNVINIHIGDKHKKSRKRHYKKSSSSHGHPITYIQPSVQVTNRLPYDTTPYSTGYMPPSMQPIAPIFSSQEPITAPVFSSQQPTTTPIATAPEPEPVKLKATPVKVEPIKAIGSYSPPKIKSESKPPKLGITQEMITKGLSSLKKTPSKVKQDLEIQDPYKEKHEFKETNPLNETRLGLSDSDDEPRKTPNSWKLLSDFARRIKKKDDYKKAKKMQYNETYNEKQKQKDSGDVGAEVFAPKLLEKTKELVALDKMIRDEKHVLGSPAMTRQATKSEHLVDKAIEEGKVRVRKPKRTKT
jgi:hypothetical protein